MKRIMFVSIFCLLAVWAFAQKKGDTMYVQVQSASLKASTGFFAKTTGTLKLGDQITVLAIQGKWAQVRSAAKSSLNGWVASASLTTKRIVVQGNTRSASASELALAGKGFSEEVEQEYKTGKDLNYSAVDELEKLRIPESDLLGFIEEGHLAKGE